MLSKSLLQNYIANQVKALYAVILSKSISVTPERHSGFIVPKFCIDSQSMYEMKGASVTATHTRLQSLYEGMTPQNKPTANMWGGTYGPRVNPLTNFLIGEYQKTLKTIGGNSHA